MAADPNFSNDDHPDRLLIAALADARLALWRAADLIAFSGLGKAQDDLPSASTRDAWRIAIMTDDVNAILLRAVTAATTSVADAL